MESLKDSPQVLAFRWTALEEGRLFEGVYMLNQARNWEEFRLKNKTPLKRIQSEEQVKRL